MLALNYFRQTAPKARHTEAASPLPAPAFPPLDDEEELDHSLPVPWDWPAAARASDVASTRGNLG